MPGIGIITNPHSKLNKRRPETPQLLGYILGEHGRLAVTQSLSDLAKVASKFRDSNIEILAINGGDGTISKTITAFIDAYGDKPLPRIALLRGGTMNVLANNLGISGTPPRILYRLCEAYSGDTPFATTRVSTLHVEGAYGFLYADGAGYRLLDEFYGNKTGPIGAALLVGQIALSALFSGKLFRRMLVPQTLTLQTDSRTQSHKSLMLLASTIERMPYGLKAFPHARQSLHQFQYASVCCEPRDVVRKLGPIALLNQPKDYENKLGGLSSLLSVTAEGEYNYSLDGELYTSPHSSVTVRMGPQIEFLKL